MRKMIWFTVCILMVGCSQEKASEVNPPTPETQAVENTVRVDEAQTEIKPEASEIKAEAPVEEEVIKAEKMKVEVLAEKDKEVTKAAQPDVKVIPKVEAQASQAAKAEENSIVVKAEKVMTEPVQAKVIAEPVQGKGEIRSEPKVAPQSGLMLKANVGDAAVGKKIAKKCMSCHTFNKGGKKKVGPNLFGIVGKMRGTFPSFKYGSYLSSVEGSWDETSLRAWVADSKGIAKAAGKKTKMASQKIKGKKADDLIAYLRTLK